MRLPDFLVIGAMKSGTTSLCRDLEKNSQIFLPSVKEPHTLCMDEVCTEEGRRKYAALFQNATPEQVCGEGSTGYTKRPYNKGVPERTQEVTGEKLKLVYIVRNPVDRTLSHHYHMYRAGDAPRDIGEAIEQLPRLIDVSRYAMQLTPWLDVFGPDNLCVIQFETYVEKRCQVIKKLSRFLGVQPDLDDVQSSIHNRGEEQLIPPSHLKKIKGKITRSQWYKRNIHPYVPQWVWDGMKRVFYKEPKERPSPPSVGIIDKIIQSVRGDVEKLSTLVGSDEINWNLEDTRRRYEAKE